MIQANKLNFPDGKQHFIFPGLTHLSTVTHEEEEVKLPIAKHLPKPLRLWWEWAEVGMTAWSRDVWAVLGWGLALVALLLTSPIYLIGQSCRYLHINMK